MDMSNEGSSLKAIPYMLEARKSPARDRNPAAKAFQSVP